jgi:predicted MFS family arabinose efflux permease
VSAYLGGQLAERYGYTSLQVFHSGMMTAALLTLIWLTRHSGSVEHPAAASLSDAA